jgi:hypothetical protein
MVTWLDDESFPSRFIHPEELETWRGVANDPKIDTLKAVTLARPLKWRSTE